MLIDAANRQTTITDQAVTPVSGGGSTITPLATYVYSYDNADRVTSEKDAEGTASFTYDNANELTAVTGSRTESYSYDLNGNRTGTGYSTTVMNETAASPGITYTYDNVGNMISAKTGSTTTTYTYDYRNRLTEVTTGGSVVATYTYNALDQRIGFKDNSTQTWTVYNGSDADATPYADFNGSGSLTERYLYGPGVVNGAVVDELLARTSSGGTTAWYLPDKLGSVRDIVSPTGTELDHIVYDSFGNVLTETNATNGDRFKYAGMEFDAAIGQYYDRARFYDAATGRFMGQDPMGFAAQDPNPDRYVGNEPTNQVDPEGLAGEPATGMKRSNDQQPQLPRTSQPLRRAPDPTEQQFIHTLRRHGIDPDSFLNGRIIGTTVPFVDFGGNHCMRWAHTFEQQNNSTAQYTLAQAEWEIIDGLIWYRHVAMRMTFRDGEVFYIDDGAIQFINGNGNTVTNPHQISTDSDIPLNWTLGGQGSGAWGHFGEGIRHTFGY